MRISKMPKLAAGFDNHGDAWWREGDVFLCVSKRLGEHVFN